LVLLGGLGGRSRADGKLTPPMTRATTGQDGGKRGVTLRVQFYRDDQKKRRTDYLSERTLESHRRREGTIREERKRGKVTESGRISSCAKERSLKGVGE